MPEPTSSQQAIFEANRDRAVRSRHGGIGAAGFIAQEDSSQSHAFLSSAGEVCVIDPPTDGFPDFVVGVAWDNVAVEQEQGFFNKLFKKKIVKSGVDLDLGCLYELKNKNRGAMQAFGAQHGNLAEEPYIPKRG
jgi:tellurite resistance protein TerA